MNDIKTSDRFCYLFRTRMIYILLLSILKYEEKTNAFLFPYRYNINSIMHYLLAEKYLTYFYATPYAVVLGNNHKQYTRVTPNKCAQFCLEEEAFICRSFDYKVRFMITSMTFDLYDIDLKGTAICSILYFHLEKTLTLIFKMLETAVHYCKSTIFSVQLILANLAFLLGSLN